MKMGELYKTAEGTEKHVPIIEIFKGEGMQDRDIVKVVVGKEVHHPNTVEHHIGWINLFGVKENGMVIDLGRSNFGPVLTEPSACYHIDTKEFKALMATSYCNIHGIWENSLDL